MMDLIGIAPTTASMRRKRSRQMTRNWKAGYLQVVEEMVDLVGITDDLFHGNWKRSKCFDTK
jgi:hypothetical protein